MRKSFLALTISLSAGMFYTVGAAEIPIDAVTSASQKFKITSGTAYPDSAVITWSTAYSNGNVFFKYGTSAGNYTTTYTMPSVSKGSHTEKIKPLKPSTTYYFTLQTLYSGTTRNTTGTFTTPAATVASFALTIKNGKGSVSCVPGTTVTISANDSTISKKEFSYWGGAKGFIDDSTKSNAKITMPNTDLTVTANYRPVVGITSVATQPNPFAITSIDKNSISLTLPSSGTYSVAAHSLQGRSLYQTQLNLRAGTAVVPVQLTSGVQIITISGSGISQSVRSIVR